MINIENLHRYITGTGQKPQDKKPPLNEIIIQSYYNFFIDGDIKEILKEGGRLLS
jgi:hypothetical protein